MTNLLQNLQQFVVDRAKNRTQDPLEHTTAVLGQFELLKVPPEKYDC